MIMGNYYSGTFFQRLLKFWCVSMHVLPTQCRRQQVNKAEAKAQAVSCVSPVAVWATGSSVIG